MKKQSGNRNDYPSLNRAEDSSAPDSEKSVYVGEEVPLPRPSPANSEDLVRCSGGINHVNIHDTGIGLDDFKLDEVFMDQFEPSVKSKLKLITGAHDNAKKYLDITVRALNNQKQYLKYMSEQNRDYQCKLESLEGELKREQALKQKAERDITMWKGECQRAEITFNKIKNRKRQIQVSLAQMYDKYDILMSENQSLRRLVESMSSNEEETRNACLPARKPNQAVPRVGLAEGRSETAVRLPPINKSSDAQGPIKTKRADHQGLPPTAAQNRRQGDDDHPDKQSQYTSSFRTPTPWYKSNDNNISGSNRKRSVARPLYRKL